MNSNKIHCPLCHGTGRIHDNTHGSVACLNCEGTGIVIFTKEQQDIIDKIKKQKEIAEKNEERKRNELLRKETEESLQSEFREQQKIRQEEQRKNKDNSTIVIIVILSIVAIGVLVWVIYINWDAIINFFKQVLMIIFGVALLLGIMFYYGKD